MYQAPPPPTFRKPIPWLLIILILGAGFVAVVGICAGAGYMAFNSLKKAPEARKGFGKPEESVYGENGWVLYRLPEVPMFIELPKKPIPDTLEFEAGSTLYTQSWIYYYLTSDLNTIELVGNWYHDESDASLEDELNYTADWVRLSMDATNVKFESRPATFAGLKGSEAYGTCVAEGDPMRFRIFYWKRDKAVFALHAYAWEESAKAAGKEFEQIAGSIKFP